MRAPTLSGTGPADLDASPDTSLAVKAAPDRSICRAGSDALRARLPCRGLRLYRAAPPGLRRHRRVGWQLRALYGAGTVRS